jgi:hypothetical protein
MVLAKVRGQFTHWSGALITAGGELNRAKGLMVGDRIDIKMGEGKGGATGRVHRARKILLSSG